MNQTFEIELFIPKAEFDIIMHDLNATPSQLEIRKMIISAEPDNEMPAFSRKHMKIKISIPWSDPLTIRKNIRMIFHGALLTGWLQGSRDAYESHSQLWNFKKEIK